MVVRVKTTVELSDDLLKRAKRLAVERGTTLRELMEAGLRRELRERERPPAAFAIEPWGDRHEPIPADVLARELHGPRPDREHGDLERRLSP